MTRFFYYKDNPKFFFKKSKIISFYYESNAKYNLEYNHIHRYEY